jgi:hypothetical protein
MYVQERDDMSDINATLDALTVKQPELPEGFAEWQCQFCEKPLVVEGADDMLLHVASEHEKMMRRFCTGLGISYVEVMTRLGDPHAVVSKHAEKPAPAPVPQVVDAPKPEPKSNAKPCVCGYVGIDGKDAGAHKRSCVIWKTENGKAPEKSSGMSDEMLFDVLEQAIKALSGITAERDSDVKVYEDFEAQKAKLQRWEEVKPTLLPLVALGYGAKEYEIADNAFKELKVRLETKIAFSDSYKRGEKAQQLVLQERISGRSELVKACSDHNAALQSKADAKAKVWEETQKVRFDQLLKGQMRVQGVTDVLSFVDNTCWRLNKEISDLSGAKLYTPWRDEEDLCEKHSRLSLEAVGLFSEKASQFNGTRKDVNDDGKVVETKHTFESVGTLPIDGWAASLTKILLYVRRAYKASNKKMKSNEAMQTPEFEAAFGWKLQEQDPSLEVARWRIAGSRKVSDKPKQTKAEENQTALEAAMKAKGITPGTVDEMLANAANGETNQRQASSRNRRNRR